MNRKNFIILAILGALLFTGIVACAISRSPIGTESDCDFGDIIERDKDCGFKKPTVKPTKKRP